MYTYTYIRTMYMYVYVHNMFMYGYEIFMCIHVYVCVYVIFVPSIHTFVLVGTCMIVMGLYLRQLLYTSAKINEHGCRDAPCEKSWKQAIPLAILSRILAQSCVTLCLNYVGRGYA